MLNPESQVNIHQDLSVTSEKHRKRKDILIDLFFDLLHSNKDLSELAVKVPIDDDVPDIKIRQFFLHLKGDMSQKKYKILDECMHFFCENLRRKTRFKNPNGSETQYDFDYQPSTFATDLKTLFGIFKSNGIQYGC